MFTPPPSENNSTASHYLIVIVVLSTRRKEEMHGIPSGIPGLKTITKKHHQYTFAFVDNLYIEAYTPVYLVKKTSIYKCTTVLAY